MPVEIREVTIKANIHTLPSGMGGEQNSSGMTSQQREDLIQEIADRVKEVLERKKGR
jgi:hypothetical protein